MINDLDAKSLSQNAVAILISEPLAIVRAGLRALLEREQDFVIVGEAGGEAELLSVLPGVNADVLLLEPDKCTLTAGQLLARIKEIQPKMAILVLATLPDERVLAQFLEAGAMGCSLKSDRPEELVRGIRTAASGETSISNTVARRLLERVTDRERRPAGEPLTERESEVFGLLMAGRSNKEIAQSLYLSVRTVEVHLRNIYGKLGVRSRLEAVARSSQRR